MKGVLLSGILSIVVFASPSKELLEYQDKYTFCKETTTKEIAKCFLNPKLNFNKANGNLFSKKKIDEENFVLLDQEKKEFYIMNYLLPKNEKYKALEDYLTYLYSMEKYAYIPKFTKYVEKGYSSKNIMYAKRMLNILLKININESELFDDEFEEALKIYQARNGFIENGKLWKETRLELNKSYVEIINKVKKNLELQRAMNNKEGTYLYINIPEYKMYFYKNNQPILDMKVIVGKKKTRTPIFSDELEYVVKNPNWNIPDNIYNKEYAHKTEEELNEMGLFYNNSGKLYQPPGKSNALGLVKFLFPNHYNVYIHDTNAPYLFKRRIRMFSHGCIRLEKPFDLMNVLGYEYDTEKTKWHKLEEKIPVYIEYHTVWIDEEGNPNFRKDIYGYERTLF